MYFDNKDSNGNEKSQTLDKPLLKDEHDPYAEYRKPPKESGVDSDFLLILGALQVFILAWFAANASYPDAASMEGTGSVSKYYSMYQDIHVMIYIGFGLLMCFLKTNNFNSVGMTFLIGVISIQYGIFFVSLMQSIGSDDSIKISLDIPTMIGGDFAAAAVLISFGAMVGRITPSQTLFMTFWELLFYALNQTIVIDHMKVADCGGSIYIHTFGAYFGLAFSWIWGKPSVSQLEAEASNYNSDMLSVIGTIFLWMFWPSFNAVLAGEEMYNQSRAVINTILALTCSCTAAFFMSHMLCDGKFDMVHIQNATLAGGVGIGTAANLYLGPWAALLTGLLSGTLSTVGYVYLSDILSSMGIHDVCGINNLHGMPGILGGIVGCLGAALAKQEFYGDNLTKIWPARPDRTAGQQALMQAAGLFVTLLMATITGMLTAFATKSIISDKKKSPYIDQDEWNVPDGFQSLVESGAGFSAPVKK